jgi:Tfp pilus assembly protein PilX
MMNPKLHHHSRPYSPFSSVSSRAQTQRGVVLVIALIVLVAMSLGGVAILRSVDTTTLIAGNYAFKQSTLHGANIGIESAFRWIATNQANLKIDNTGEGYYSWTSRLSSQQFNWQDSTKWSAAKTVNNTPDAAGNTVQYIIHRLCTTPGRALTLDDGVTANPCATNAGSGTSATYSAPSEGSSNVSGSSAFTSPPSIVLRVIARSTGPRNAVSYVQAMVLLPN